MDVGELVVMGAMCVLYMRGCWASMLFIVISENQHAVLCGIITQTTAAVS